PPHQEGRAGGDPRAPADAAVAALAGGALEPPRARGSSVARAALRRGLVALHERDLDHALTGAACRALRLGPASHQNADAELRDAALDEPLTHDARAIGRGLLVRGRVALGVGPPRDHDGGLRVRGDHLGETIDLGAGLAR